MRELTVRIRFVSPCLGNAKDGAGNLKFARTPSGDVTFLASWHMDNMRLAARLLGRHQDEVQKILWDVAVDGVVAKGKDRWHKRYFTARDNHRRRFARHECFQPGQVVGLNCLVPNAISDDDLLQLMTIAGKYKGLSPFRPGEFGHYTVESITLRRSVPATPDGPVSRVEAALTDQASEPKDIE